MCVFIFSTALPLLPSPSLASLPTSPPVSCFLASKPHGQREFSTAQNCPCLDLLHRKPRPSHWSSFPFTLHQKKTKLCIAPWSLKTSSRLVCPLCLERPAPISPLLTWIFLLHSPKLYSDITSSSESFLSLLTLESRLWTLNTQCLSLTVLYWLWLSICELLEGKACILSLNRWHTAATCKMFILSKIL